MIKYLDNFIYTTAAFRHQNMFPGK